MNSLRNCSLYTHPSKNRSNHSSRNSNNEKKIKWGNKKSRISHEDEESAGSPLGLVRVLAGLPLSALGGLLRPLTLHRQPAETNRTAADVDRDSEGNQKKKSKACHGSGAIIIIIIIIIIITTTT